MNDASTDPNRPQPTPGNPYPEPARPSSPPETTPDEPAGIPAPTPDPIPSPVEEPVQIPPGSPQEVPTEPGFPAPTAALMVAVAAAALLCWPGAASLALAQTAGGDGAPAAQDSPCRVDPGSAGDDAQRGSSGSGEAGGSDAAARPSLEDCNGVLVPPKIGDGDIVEPAPDTGTTPVIPPGAVPTQPANPDQPQ